MPDVGENQRIWDGSYDWPEAGDEWSAAWGDATTQWNATVFPRLQPLLPAKRVLEIGPGHGRWARFLLPLCESYVGIDLSTSAVEACRQRFAGDPRARFATNDGRSLDAAEEGSVDLAFSFDSLVHVEPDVMAAYLRELSRTLAADGVAFLHHSNLGEYQRAARLRRARAKLRPSGPQRESAGWTHWRSLAMTAELFPELCAYAGLVCVGQEKINWLGSRLIDCISVAAKPGSRWERPNVVVRNPYFMTEAASAACVAAVYGGFRAGDQRHPGAVPTGSIRYFGASRIMLASRSIGPWNLSIQGPFLRRRR